MSNLQQTGTLPCWLQEAGGIRRLTLLRFFPSSLHLVFFSSMVQPLSQWAGHESRMAGFAGPTLEDVLAVEHCQKLQWEPVLPAVPIAWGSYEGNEKAGVLLIL